MHDPPRGDQLASLCRLPHGWAGEVQQRGTKRTLHKRAWTQWEHVYVSVLCVHMCVCVCVCVRVVPTTVYVRVSVPVHVLWSAGGMSCHFP